MQFKDYYKILGVSETASADEIKAAYRKLARKYHPDVSKEENAEDKFKEVGEAYEALRDPEKRAHYDQVRKGGFYQQGGDFRPPPGWEPGGGSAYQTQRPGFGDFSDFFEALFGMGAGDFGQQARQPRQQRGTDVQAELRIDLETAITGGQRRVSLGTPSGDRVIDVKIPPGVTSGTKMRLSGQGNPGAGGGPSGDLLLKIDIATHPHFQLKGRNVESQLAISPWEAALGAKVPARTPGGSVELTIPPGARTGQRLRLKGKGLPGNPAGDQLVELQIQTPPASGDEDEAFYREMAERFSFEPRS